MLEASWIQTRETKTGEGEAYASPSSLDETSQITPSSSLVTGVARPHRLEDRGHDHRTGGVEEKRISQYPTGRSVVGQERKAFLARANGDIATLRRCAGNDLKHLAIRRHGEGN